MNTVGEIEDETDDAIEEDIKHLAGQVYQVKALTEIEDFNNYFNLGFNEDDADTIGGIILQHFGHMPKKDEQITINDVTFKVTAADKRRIQTFQVTIPKTHKVTDNDLD